MNNVAIAVRKRWRRKDFWDRILQSIIDEMKSNEAFPKIFMTVTDPYWYSYSSGFYIRNRLLADALNLKVVSNPTKRRKVVDILVGFSDNNKMSSYHTVQLTTRSKVMTSNITNILKKCINDYRGHLKLSKYDI